MSPVKNLEEFFLRVFKVAVLVLMGLALVVTIIFSAIAAYQYLQSPKEPAPAQKAPEKEISIDDLKAFLLDQEKSKGGKEEPTKQRPPKEQPSLRFLEDATRVFRCAGKFAEESGIVADNADDAQRLESLRAEIERLAEHPMRGESWVKSNVAFTCKVLADTSIVVLRKEKKIGSVFLPTVNFHIRAWDKIQAEKAEFEERENSRVESERMAEQNRVAAARMFALTSLIGAASAFGMFMLLAFYLIGAKIENNLRNINESIRTRA